jgi:hypothetical protein
MQIHSPLFSSLLLSAAGNWGNLLACGGGGGSQRRVWEMNVWGKTKMLVDWLLLVCDLLTVFFDCHTTGCCWPWAAPGRLWSQRQPAAGGRSRRQSEGEWKMEELAIPALKAEIRHPPCPADSFINSSRRRMTSWIGIGIPVLLLSFPASQSPSRRSPIPCPVSSDIHPRRAWLTHSDRHHNLCVQAIVAG